MTIRIAHRAAAWLRTALNRRGAEREMQQEMAEHIQLAIDRLKTRGLTEADARREAMNEFGSLALLQDLSRDAWGGQWWDTLLRDCRFAVRQFARAPLTAAVIVFTLTLGIGVNTALYSAIDGTFFRPPPGIPDDPSLVLLRGLAQVRGREIQRSFSYPEVREYAALDSVFSSVAAWTPDLTAAAFEGDPASEAMSTVFVTPNYFDVLGVRPSGPGFAVTRPDVAGTPPDLSVVISDGLARGRFASPTAALGHTVRLNAVELRIVAVAPPRFAGGIDGLSNRRAWVPLSARATVLHAGASGLMDPDSVMVQAAARVVPHASSRAMAAILSAIASRASQNAAHDRATAWRTEAVRFTQNADVMRGGDYAIVSLGVLLATIILLVCTTTVSSLLVGSAVRRRHEIGIRLALGASRGRLVRQLLVETGILAVVSGVCGFALLLTLCRIYGAQIPDVDQLTPDWSALFFACTFALATALLCGLSPALHAVREGVAETLKDSTTGVTARSKLQRSLIVSQIALTQPLLVSLALLIVTVVRSMPDPNRVSVAERIVEAQFSTGTVGADGRVYLGEIARRIRQLPGVTAVVPRPNGYQLAWIGADASGTPGGPGFEQGRIADASPGYVSVMNMRVLHGRDLEPSDSAVGTAMLIGDGLARRLFGSANVVGRRIVTKNGPVRTNWEIVGVVDEGNSQVRSGSGDPEVYVSSRRGPYSASSYSLMVRTAGPGALMIPTLHALARAQAPQMPVLQIRTLAERDENARRERVQMLAAASAGGLLALFFASVGLYAMVALSVSQRKREIGLRVALGARPSQVVGVFFRSGLRLTAWGLAIGLPVSGLALAVFASQAGIRSNTPLLLAIIGVLVVAVASFATWLPARRAAALDPLIALRAD